MNTFKRRPKDHIAEILAMPVLKFPGRGGNTLTMGDFFDGNACFGSAGSGKTSGFLTYALDALLRHQLRPGGLILTVKKDDRLRWEQLIREAGREDDLVIISPQNNVKINLIEHEIKRTERHNIEYDNVRNLLMECMISAESYDAGGGKRGSDERFWDKQMALMLVRMMMLLVLAEAPITVGNMRKVLVDAFREGDIEQYIELWEQIQNDDPQVSNSAIDAYETWKDSNAFLKYFDTANARQDLFPEEAEVLELVADYFLKMLPRMAEKTRSNIEASVLGLSEPFLTGVLKTHFSQEMSPEAQPENCYKNGTILLLDVPLKEYGVVAIYAAAMVKKLFQLTMERRVISEEEEPRPVFLFQDEFHLLVSPRRDYEFQSTCRSTFTVSIIATQSVNNIKAALGGGTEAEVQTKSLLSNLRNQVFCANMCRDTNIYAAELIGKDFLRTNSSTTNDRDQGSFTTSESLHYIVPPEHFTTLKSGGPNNDFEVESIVISRGQDWSTSERFLEVIWDQLRSKRGWFSKLTKFFLK